MTNQRHGQLPVRDQLRRIIADLADGVLAIEPDGSIGWANRKALAMHGARSEEQLGGCLDEYAQRFELRYRNGRRLDPVDYPACRALRGEVLEGVIVQVAETGGEPQWTHKISSISIEDRSGGHDFVVLVLDDATDAFKAQTRFEKVVAANPAPAAICRLADQRYVKVNRGLHPFIQYAASIISTLARSDLPFRSRINRSTWGLSRSLPIEHFSSALSFQNFLPSGMARRTSPGARSQDAATSNQARCGGRSRPCLAPWRARHHRGEERPVR